MKTTVIGTGYAGIIGGVCSAETGNRVTGATPVDSAARNILGPPRSRDTGSTCFSIGTR